MARKKKSIKTVEKRDLGTPETRRRLTSDPLLSSDIEPPRLQATLAIRAALEDGLGARALDMVRIGMRRRVVRVALWNLFREFERPEADEKRAGEPLFLGLSDFGNNWDRIVRQPDNSRTRWHLSRRRGPRLLFRQHGVQRPILTGTPLYTVYAAPASSILAVQNC